MKTAPECLPCFLKQTIFCASICQLDDTQTTSLVQEIASLLPKLDTTQSPPENAVVIYNHIAKTIGNDDIFRQVKSRETQRALTMLENVAAQIQSAHDPLFAALQFALAGNIIDYGSQQHFDIDATLADCLTEAPRINDYHQLTQELREAESVLYLGDNAGETVFDRLLIEQLGKQVWYAVKESPIINDATMDDARQAGLDKCATLISNGTGCPGTPLNWCSQEFREIFQQADIIISKGQGNFETLSDVQRPVYFLLTVKCPIVARHISQQSELDSPLLLGQKIIFRHAAGGSGINTGSS